MLRDRGESQELEYIAGFPTNARELAKEIAAFATSNHGLVLLGVGDAGELIGLEEVENASGRDQLIRRVEQLCRGQIKPAITPTARWAVEKGKVVLAIRVPRGSQPFYFAGSTPYLRHLTESRPAEPHEVLELVEVWLEERGRLVPPSHGKEKQDPELSSFMGDLAVLVRDLLIFGHEVDARTIDPWLDMLMSQFSGAASELRRLAVASSASRMGLSEELKELADDADETGHYLHVLGRESWRSFTSLVQGATSRAANLKREHVDKGSFPEGFEKQSLERLREATQLMAGLAEEADERVRRIGITEILEEVGEVGLRVRAEISLQYLG